MWHDCNVAIANLTALAETLPHTKITTCGTVTAVLAGTQLVIVASGSWADSDFDELIDRLSEQADIQLVDLPFSAWHTTATADADIWLIDLERHTV